MAESRLRQWTAIISHYSRKGFYEETLRLFRQMQDEGVPLNRFIFPSVLRSASKLSDSKTGRSLHSSLLRSLLSSDPFISCSLIDFYSKCGRFSDARHVFDEMPQRDLATWNSLVSGYVSQGLLEEGMSLFLKMQSYGPKPDSLTWNSLISGFAQSGDERTASRLFDSMNAAGIEADVFTWTSLISASVQNFSYRKAFALFREMMAVPGIRPNAATISSILPASANSMSLKAGWEIHAYSVVNGIERDLFVSSSLVDMYAKCGLVSDASKVFDKMPLRNTVAWNSMIFACANHGQCGRAIELFLQMEKFGGAKPDHLTFTAVLTACSHAGMVKLGNDLFRFMQEGCGIVPRGEHYACMVDLFGRAGEILRAYDLIRGMPLKPDFFVWGALLGACRIYGEVEVAEIAARHLRELEPRSAGSFCLLSSVMLNVGRLQDGEELLREKKKKKQLRRYLGCSWTLASSLKESNF